MENGNTRKTKQCALLKSSGFACAKTGAWLVDLRQRYWICTFSVFCKEVCSNAHCVLLILIQEVSREKDCKSAK